MIKFFVKHIEKTRKHIQESWFSQKGQTAVVLILVAAIALILYAVTLNFGRAAQTKVATIRASNMGASYLASLMASYGEQLVQTYLKGGDKYCKETSVWTALWKGALLVIAIIIAAIFAPYLLPYLITALVMVIVAIVIQAMVIQPALTRAWNKMMQDSLNIEGQFMEKGIQTALQAVAEDREEIPDLYDLDMDGKFGLDPGGIPLDLINRFSFYNTQRLSQTPDTGDDVMQFIGALERLVYNRNPPPGDLWQGLYDPEAPCGSDGPAECDQCCVPKFALDLNGQAVCQDGTTTPLVDPETDPCDPATHGPAERLRPACCDEGTCDDKPEDPGTCWARSWYSLGAGNNQTPRNYPWLYDRFYENPDPNAPNARNSFREQLGRDDEHHWYIKETWDPSLEDTNQCRRQTNSPAAEPAPDDQSRFRIEDASGYEPYFCSAPIDHKDQGIFPFFYSMADWAINLRSINWNPEWVDLAANLNYCHWCDFRIPTAAGDALAPPVLSNACGGAPNLPLNQIGGALELVDVPGDPGAQHNGGWCIDITTGPNPMVPDAVGRPNLFADDGLCALGTNTDISGQMTQQTGSPGSAISPGWKRGADRFCSADYIYSSGCFKHGVCPEPVEGGTVPLDCACGQLDAEDGKYWPDDTLDEIIYGLPDFFLFAEALISQTDTSEGQNNLTNNFKSWYDDAADWIEWPCPGAVCPVDESFTRLDRAGTLHRWVGNMQYYVDRIDDWILRTPFSDVRAWCMPPENKEHELCVPGHSHDPATVPATEEAATFDSNNNGVRGDLEDVIACLNWNMNDLDPDKVFIFDPAGAPAQPLITQAHNNAEKFNICASYIFPAAAWDPSKPNDDENLASFNDTIAQCALNIDLCSHLPRSVIGGMCLNGLPPWPWNVFDYGGYKDQLQAMRACYDTVVTSLNAPGGQDDKAVIACSDVCSPVSVTNPHMGAAYANNDPISPSYGINLTYSGFGIKAGDFQAPNFVPMAAPAVARCAKGSADLLMCPAGMEVLDAPDHPVPAAIPPTPDPCVCSSDAPAAITPRSCTDPAFAEKLRRAITQASYHGGGGTCVDSSFLDNAKKSAAETRNLFKKFERRRDFLLARLAEARRVRNILQTGIDNINVFLAEARKLIALRGSSEAVSAELPSTAVYVWRDTIPGTDPSTWPVHAVKVEARLPLRCNDACGVHGGDDPRWPYIRTYTRGFMNRRRCYRLTDYEGMVKVRVIRYDQGRTGNELRFPNGSLIWRMQSARPDTTGALTGGIFGEPCFSAAIHPDLQNDKRYLGAFMLNGPPGWHCPIGTPASNPFCSQYPTTSIDGGNYENCWARVHSDLLRHGVETTTCARYYYSNEGGSFGRRGMRLRFVPCDAGFVAGSN